MGAGAALGDRLAQALQVGAHDGADVGVDDRGGRALVLLDLGQDVVAGADGAARRALAHDRLQRPLVRRIGEGVDEADGDGVDALGQQPVDGGARVLGIQRLLHIARRVDALVHHRAQVALDQGLRLLPREVVEPGHPQVADLQHVAEAARADQPGAGALALQQGVAGDGGSVHHLGDVGAVDRVLGDEGGHALHDGPRVVVDAGGDLARRDRAVLGEQNDIGEGAPDIDADAPAAHAPLSGAAFRGSGIGPRETAGGSDQPRAALSSARRASVAASSTRQRARSTITP